MTATSNSTLTVAAAQSLCLERRVPFYSYRLPRARDVFFGAQLSPDLQLFPGFERHERGEGFLVAPFSPSSWSFPYFIKADVAFSGELTDARSVEMLRATAFPEVFPPEHRACEPSRQEYLDRARELLAIIERENLRKVVLSRPIDVPDLLVSQAPALFEQALSYDNAFVFLFSLPGRGVWAGASPELFLKYDREGFCTVALAGTLPVADATLPLSWPAKDLEEQRMVDDYIAGVLAHFFTRNLEREETTSLRAGNLYHLCTSFRSDEQLPADEIDLLVAQLHPTPAICGLPKKRAMQVISDMEWLERGYYGGLVGPVHPSGAFDLYLNIRSLEFFESCARLRVGGGITLLSDPREEWEETCRKADAWLDLIKNMKHGRARE
jgi:isochorismate synthase